MAKASIPRTVQTFLNPELKYSIWWPDSRHSDSYGQPSNLVFCCSTETIGTVTLFNAFKVRIFTTEVSSNLLSFLSKPQMSKFPLAYTVHRVYCILIRLWVKNGEALEVSPPSSHDIRIIESKHQSQRCLPTDWYLGCRLNRRIIVENDTEAIQRQFIPPKFLTINLMIHAIYDLSFGYRVHQKLSHIQLCKSLILFKKRTNIPWKELWGCRRRSNLWSVSSKLMIGKRPPK